jgi:hypothetical protein
LTFGIVKAGFWVSNVSSIAIATFLDGLQNFHL